MMLSRANSTASNGLKRTQSSTSIQTRRGDSSLSTEQQNVEAGRQQAFIAANVAFERASQGYLPTTHGAQMEFTRRLAIADTTDILGAESPNGLGRRESIRFTGPRATPNGQREITRRQAAIFDDSSVHTSEAIVREERDSMSGELRPASSVTALPRVDSVTSTPPSFRRIRKVKSMLTPRKSPTGGFFKSTPKSQERSQHKFGRQSSSDDAQLPRVDSRRSASLLREVIGSTLPKHSMEYNQDAAIQVARDQYLRQLEGQRLKEKSSMLSVGKNKRSQRAFRKTVRTSSTNSYGSAVGSTRQPDISKAEGFGNRARNVSHFLKERIRRVFRKTPDSIYSIPSQQVDAQRAHFGHPLGNKSEVDPEPIVYPMPGGELLERVSSRGFSGHNLPLHLDRNYQVGSIRSVHSGSPSIDQSRATSWTNSTTANTMTAFQMMERKRLSIIQENGGPHQPSSSAGAIGNAARKGYAAFRKPLRGYSGSSRVNGPVDSQRIFSALQRRFGEHHRSLGRGELVHNNFPGMRTSSRQASAASFRNVSDESHGSGSTTVRMSTDHSDESFAERHPLKYSKSVNFGKASSSSGDDVFQASPIPHIGVAPKPELCGGKLTYQQIAERNEYREREQRKPLREVKSAFFPAAAFYQNEKVSPYRRAIRSSMDDSIGSVQDGLLTESNIGTPTPKPSRLAVPPRSSTVTESIYSRQTDGTPKQFRSAFSPSNSDSSGEPGTAYIMTNAFGQPEVGVSSLQRKVSSPVSSGEWKGWMSSYVSALDNSSSESLRDKRSPHIVEATHRREHAQINGEDSHIGGSHRNPILLARQPSTIMATKVSRPPLQHKTSDQALENNPLRFPLFERTASAGGNIVRKQARKVARDMDRPGGSSNDENRRNSSSQAYQGSDVIRRKMSQATMTSHDSRSHASRIRVKPTRSNDHPASDAIEQLQLKSSPSVHNRYSPERASRLRRMQSLMASDARAHGLVQNLALRGNPYELEDDVTPRPTPEHGSEARRAGLPGPMISADQPSPGTQVLVEQFLQNRRHGRDSPAFL